MRRKENNKLKKLHIFDKVWCIGKPNKIGDHAVIYGPDDKEYHLDKQWIKYLHIHDEGDYYPEETNRWNLGRVKTYILSAIIDPGNWVFDIEKIPGIGSNIKVIYENGTVKWIESFSGDFKDHVYEKKEMVPMRTNQAWLDWHYRGIRKDNEKTPSQFEWEERTRTRKVIAWRLGE